MTSARRAPVLGTVLALVSACAPALRTTPARADTAPAMDAVSAAYVELVLAVGLHDHDYVDAYYGPPALGAKVEAERPSLEAIRARASALAGAVEDGDDELARLRAAYLRKQLDAVIAHVDRLRGDEMTFAEEARVLYDVAVPRSSDADFQPVLDELDRILPGRGSLAERHEAFRERFRIPPERIDVALRTALEACRTRTRRHLDLPDGERFDVEYVTDRPWSAYHWYRGGYESLIQVNTGLPIHVDRVIELACHEGYPGHHVQNTLLERDLTRARGWIEFTVYPLFSPQSLIAEGTASFGVELAFPPAERAAFEKAELFPLAGLDPATADLYHQVQALTRRLSPAVNGVAAAYLDGEIGPEEAVTRLTTLSLQPRERARQTLQFIDRFGAYIVSYNRGEELVRAHIRARAGDDPERRWRELGRLIASPLLPSGLE